MRNRLLLMARKRLVPGASAIYLCNEGTGTTLTDYSGNGKDGTLGAAGAAPTWGTDGLSFDGGDSVQCGDLGGYAYAFTVAFYVAGNINASSAAQALAGFSRSTAAVPVPWSRFVIGGIAGDGIDNEVIQVAGQATGDGVVYETAWCDTSPTAIPAGWHTAGFSWNGEYYDIYLDGVKRTATANANGHCKLLRASNLVFGGRQYADSIGWFFTGKIGAGVVHPFALTEAQMQQNHRVIRDLLAPRGVDINL